MKIICVGRNYAAHAAELQNAVPDKPLIFLKPESAILNSNAAFTYPDFSNDIHFECELVFYVGKGGKEISEENAMKHIRGVALGIDFTARDLQDEIKKKGHPWTLAKMFDESAPVSVIQPIEDFPAHDNLRFDLRVNGELRQSGYSGDMLFPLPVLIAYISKFITLMEGDLIFTGTPEGVGSVKVGDRLQARLEGKELLDFYVK
jgi:acylpyruvate hydrolase